MSKHNLIGSPESFDLVFCYEFTGQLELLAEYHGTARSHFGWQESVVNFGVRRVLNQTLILQASAGRHFLHDGPDLIAYAGVQLGF